MCEPVSASTALYVTLAASAASAAMAVKQQQDAASVQQQQNDAQVRNNQAQYNNTMITAANNNSQVNLKEQQMRAQTIDKLNLNNIEATKAYGKSTAIAGVNGVGGNSVAAALGAISGTSEKYNASVLANYDSGISSTENERSNLWSNAASTINGLQTPRAVIQPDYMSAGLKIANLYGQYSTGSANLNSSGGRAGGSAPVTDYSTPI